MMQSVTNNRATTAQIHTVWLKIDWQAVSLFLFFWVSRIWQIKALPLHVDEGIHLRTALKFWEGNPLWRVSNGKIIGHWPIAALLPQNEPVFVARIATVLVVLVGFTAGYVLVRRLFGRRAALLAGLLWLAAPYMLFFERTALMDAQTGALVVLAVWAAVELLRRDRAWLAILTGLIVLTAILFKLTALPVIATVGFIVLFLGKETLQRRLRHLLLIAATLVVCLALPLLLLLPRLLGASGGAGLGSFSFDIPPSQIAANLNAFADSLTGFGTLIWPALLIVGLILLALLRRKDGLILVVAPLPLLLTIIIFSSNVFLRYFAVVLPLWLLLGGAGLGLALEALSPISLRRALTSVGVALLAFGFIPFAHTAYTAPGQLPLPVFMRLQYVTEHSAGFGLREAALDVPNTISQPDTPIVASLFADSCRRTRFYLPPGYDLICTDQLGVAEIEAALADQGRVYILADRPPYTGIDVSTIDGQASRIAAYPRPGDSEANASITLWLIERIE